MERAENNGNILPSNPLSANNPSLSLSLLRSDRSYHARQRNCRVILRLFIMLSLYLVSVFSHEHTNLIKTSERRVDLCTADVEEMSEWVSPEIGKISY